jgi:hypothetical protein
MSKKRWLCAVDELGILIEVFEYLSRYASETLSAYLGKHLSINLFGALRKWGEKQDIFNAQ